jgi:transposase
VTRRELSDDEWELIEPFLPTGRYGPFPRHLRAQFEGVIWRVRTGSQWREMPEEFGAWQTGYDRFTQWRNVGIAPATVDSPVRESERAERRRLRRRRRARLKAAALGRSRGGLTSKVHLAEDRRCRPLAFGLMPGQAAGSPAFVAVLEKVKVRGPVSAAPGWQAGRRERSGQPTR